MCALSFLGPVPDCQVHSFAPLAKHEAMNASDALVLRGGGFFMSRPDCQVTQVGIAMRIWILSESDTLADMIRRPLQRMGIDGASTSAIGADQIEQLAATSDERSHIVFFA